jgi:hypothetical protein
MDDDELELIKSARFHEELSADKFIGKDEMKVPPKKRKLNLGHKNAWRNLFVGLFITDRPRDIAFLVLLVWLCLGVTLFFTMQLIGFIYQQTLSEHLISGYTERYVGCWFTVVVAVALSFTRLFMIWFRYRCC